MRGRDIAPGIHLLDLRFMGVEEAIGAFVLTGADGSAALIETGPSTTGEALLSGLQDLEIDPGAIEDVIVTHIHLDHSGGAGRLLHGPLSRARVYVHPVGRPHLADPSRLIVSAGRLYGETMDELWGEVVPIDEDRLVPVEDGDRLRLAGHELKILHTPGHASHHIAVQDLGSGVVFAGDVAGVRPPGGHLVVPPTVPPEFDMERWSASLERLRDAAPPALLLTHYGLVDEPKRHLDLLEERLHRWLDLAAACVDEGSDASVLAGQLQEETRSSVAGDVPARQVDLIAGYRISAEGLLRYASRPRETS